MTWWNRGIIERLGLHAPSARRKGREGLIERILDTAATAEAEGDPDTMRSCSYKLIRYELYERAWELRVRAVRLKQQRPIPEWEGDDIAGRDILVESYAPKDRIGEELRLARFIAPVANRARRCIVLAEHRLVPLLRRSFPAVDVRPRGINDAAAFAEADVAAYYETIALRFGKNAEEIRRAFVPLRADPRRVTSIRQRYRRASDAPLIGLSWGSSNESKVLPSLEDWAPLLDWSAANFVSLQYGDIKRDLEVLRSFAGSRVIHDQEIDQLTDLDGFAAQIGALDAVVSISNTAIDMAGMLGVPTLHIRDDKSSAIWPQSGPSPWYPGMVFLYKQKRPWPELFAEARGLLEQMVSRVAA